MVDRWGSFPLAGVIVALATRSIVAGPLVADQAGLLADWTMSIVQPDEPQGLERAEAACGFLAPGGRAAWFVPAADSPDRLGRAALASEELPVGLLALCRLRLIGATETEPAAVDSSIEPPLAWVDPSRVRIFRCLVTRRGEHAIWLRLVPAGGIGGPTVAEFRLDHLGPRESAGIRLEPALTLGEVDLVWNGRESFCLPVETDPAAE